MMPVSMISTPSPLSEPNLCPAQPRPVAHFTPSPWGDRFLDYTLDTKAMEAQEEIVNKLKEELKKELLLSLGEKPLMEQLHVIDSIERLGVAYHFEMEIEDTLRCIHENLTDLSFDDLILTSLCFRLLRQHGFNISSDVFKKFIESNGSFKVEVANDIRAMISLYEACHVRGHEENILEEGLEFTKSNLNKVLSDHLGVSPSLEECVLYALHKPLNKRLMRVECVRYMRLYEEDNPGFHNKTLLKFAKLDFNLLQASHKKELSEISRWWKSIAVTSALPLRDRIVESYFWGSAVYFQPQYDVARKITIMGCQILTSVDDVYDAYATLEELEILTEAVRRWDMSCIEELPKDIGCFYKNLINTHEEMERNLAPQGRSQYVHYAKEEVKALCEAYLIEAKWRHNKYIPKLDEYMAIAHRNVAYVAAVCYTFLGMEMATGPEFEWIWNLSKPVKAVSLLLRILDDIGGTKFDEVRGHPRVIIECYMKEYGITCDEAYKMLYNKVDELWKDLNESVVLPREVPMPLLTCVLNLGRAVETIYDAGEDSFTSLNLAMKQNIENLYINPILDSDTILTLVNKSYREN